MKIILHSTDNFKTIDGKPHRIWIGTGRQAVKVTAYIDHLEVSSSEVLTDFDSALKRVEN